MYLRKICRQKDGKPHYYWALIESYRTQRGPRQRVVSYLGEMDESGRVGVKEAAEGYPEEQYSLFEEKEAEWVEIDIRRVRTERNRRFGDIWLARELLKKLGLIEFFNKEIERKRGKISWAELASVLVIARFCEVRSELSIAEHFYSSTALSDILGIPEEAIYDNRLYRALDKLLPHKDKLQEHLKERFGEMFGIEYDILLYDVTSTYFEGEAKGNPQAKRGYSRDHRPDCKQVCIGLVVTREGIPLGYEVFDGNRHDSKTVTEIVNKMESLYGKSDRVWIMDRGMVSEETLKLINEEKRRYIIGTHKSQLKKFEQQLMEKDWKEVRDGVEVKICTSEAEAGEREEVYILCRSKSRSEKEHAIHKHFKDNIETGLKRIEKSCKEGRVKKINTVERRIGRLLQQNQRAAKLFDIEVKELSEEGKGKIKISWTIKSNDTDWWHISEGCYLLRSNIKDWSAEELWKAYIQLTAAEDAFRIQKDDLELRPVWHQKEDRVKAHIFVCFIAYVMWKCFGQLCKQAGIGNEPRKVIEEMKSITLTDVVLPTRKGADITLRCVSKPEEPLLLLLHKLKLQLPLRMKIDQLL